MMKPLTPMPDYDEVLTNIVDLLERARRASVRAVSTIMATTYWKVGRQIVEGDQKGADRAEYGTRMVERLSVDLTAKFGRGFGAVNLTQMRRFYLAWPATILQTPSEEFSSPCDESTYGSAGGSSRTLSAQSPSDGSEKATAEDRSHKIYPSVRILQTPSEGSRSNQKKGVRQTKLQTPTAKLTEDSPKFSLPSSHYLELLAVEEREGREFYETEAAPRRLVGTTTAPTDREQVLRADAAFPQ